MTKPTQLTDAPVLLAAMGLAPLQLQSRLATLASAARANWINRAKNSLRSTERDYVNGIQPEVVEGHTAWIALVGTVPNMVERGWYSGVGVDLRDTLLRPGAPGVKQSKTGHLYRAIAFRHMTPTSTSRNAPAMGSAYARVYGTEGAQAIGKAAYKQARRLEPTFTQGDKTAWGGRLSPAFGGPLLRPRHATGLYSGMYRFGRAYGKTTQYSYGTFRMISTNPATFRSDSENPNPGRNWRHPGIVARNFAAQVQVYVNQIATSALFQGKPQGGEP